MEVVTAVELMPMQFPFVVPFPSFWCPATPPGVQHLPGSAGSSGQPGSASSPDQEEEDDDVVEYLREEEAMEFSQFDPTVTKDNPWEAGEVIDTFLKKHFNRSVLPEERDCKYPNWTTR